MSKPVDIEKLRSIGISAKAVPSRRGAVVATEATERQWSKDFDAYRRLRKDGLQPRTSDGAAELEKRAETPEQVESRPKVDLEL